MLKISDLIKAFYDYNSSIILVIDELNNEYGILEKETLINESARGNMFEKSIKDVISFFSKNIDYPELLQILEARGNSAPAIDRSGEQIQLFTLEPKDEEEIIPFGLAIQSLPVGIIICSNLNNVTYLNKSAESILGMKESAVLGKNINTLLPESNLTEAFHSQSIVFEIRIGTEARPYACISRVIKRGSKNLGTIIMLIEIKMIKSIYNEIPEQNEEKK